MDRSDVLRAVLLRDLLDGDANLVAQVPPSVHHTIRPLPKNHFITVLIGLVNVLKEENKSKTNEWEGNKKQNCEDFYFTQARKETRIPYFYHNM